ncbi:efflux RND transporter periplasmic adaptor subunit [Marinisporobacter balticus]|uniref:RND family efflux transporter MFP subunit n=1 Tax=Marinisporobacter balticus TaxID=2018667 RepID=A0A4R2L1M5_9FIRM|nr:efflux RND transporter periplasmic adaptor subunit [Marinisporobacter balticus]TCO79512.1 RND family efflux transporter MFP subunit [Marinisporobacter balticus]
MCKKIVLVFAVILLVTMTITGCGKKQPAIAKEEPLIRVQTAIVKKQDLTLKTTLSGKIRPIEESSIVAKTPGKVMNVHVEIGDRIQKGNVLFELDQKDILNTVKSAEASYAATLANLTLTQETVDHNLKNHERNKALYEQGAISEQVFEDSALKASTAQLEQVKAQVEQARVTLENAKSRLSDCIVSAPISGFITSVDISSGEIASSGMSAITIANLDIVLIETSISEHLINKVHTGDEVDVLVKSASNASLKGRIFALSPSPTKNGLTYPMKISLENKDTLVKAGMFAEISIVSDKKENILIIPSDSVVVKNGKEVVFVVHDHQTQLQEVSLGIDNGKEVEVTNGLKEGDLIVIKGQNYLENGNKVQIIK